MCGKVYIEVPDGGIPPLLR